MTDLLEPFSTAFMLRALLGGVLVAALCGVVGTWVVVRGTAFLGEAMAHGLLPGVAVATLLGLPPVAGAAASAAVMTAGLGLVQRRVRLSQDTVIGLLYVGMLAVGVVIVSRSRSFATDLTAILFGDVLAIQRVDLVFLAVALAVTLVLVTVLHRSFVALAFDERVARTLGLHPRLAQVVLVGLVTLVVVASYQAVGSLLVLGLLLAPAVAAGHWMRRVPSTMALAVVLGAVAVTVGLLVSWHAGTAAGATIAAAAVALAAASGVLRTAVARAQGRRAAGGTGAGGGRSVAGEGSGASRPSRSDTPAAAGAPAPTAGADRGVAPEGSSGAAPGRSDASARAVRRPDGTAAAAAWRASGTHPSAGGAGPADETGPRPDRSVAPAASDPTRPGGTDTPAETHGDPSTTRAPATTGAPTTTTVRTDQRETSHS